MGVIASGTAVSLNKKSDYIARGESNSNVFNVSRTNAYDVLMINKICFNENEAAIIIKNYGRNYRAINADVVITTLFNETFEYKDIIFSGFELSGDGELISNTTTIDIPQKIYAIIKSVDVMVIRYVVDDTVNVMDRNELQSIEEVQEEYKQNNPMGDYFLEIGKFKSVTELQDYHADYCDNNKMPLKDDINSILEKAFL